MDNYDDLPPEVIKELSWGGANATDQKLIAIVNEHPPSVGLDLIIIEMWRRHKRLVRRRWLMGKMYRLAMAGHVQKDETQKGFYSPTTGCGIPNCGSHGEKP